MTQVEGIQFNRNSSGVIKSVTFDLKKHGDLIKPILDNLGVIEDLEGVEKESVSVETAKKEMVSHLQNFQLKK